MLLLKTKEDITQLKVGFFKIKSSKLSKQMKGYFAKKIQNQKKF